MKKLIIWLAKKFDVSIEKVVYVNKIVEVPVPVLLTDVIEGDVLVKGNLTVKGNLKVEGDVIAFNMKQIATKVVTKRKTV